MSTTHGEPASAPVSLAEMKAFLRVGNDAEDALIDQLVGAATGLCESFTGRALIAREVEDVLPASTAWARLGAQPVRSIAAVAALDIDGVATALEPRDYAIDVDAAGDGWVRLVRPGSAKRVRVSYEAGISEAPDGLPESLRHGIMRLAAYFHAHRDGREQAPPAAVTALWRPWRRVRLG